MLLAAPGPQLSQAFLSVKGTFGAGELAWSWISFLGIPFSPSLPSLLKQEDVTCICQVGGATCSLVLLQGHLPRFSPSATHQACHQSK